MNKDEIPGGTPAELAFALATLGANTAADAFTPVTVRVHDMAGEVTYPGEPVYYSVVSVAYDAQRDEYVLSIDQSQPAPGRCEITMSHTRTWCGNPRCRER